MLRSVEIQRRQSEVRERLAALSGNDTPADAEINEMRSLDKEYQANEARYRAALIAEDGERKQATKELGNAGNEWRDLLADFELRQAALHLDEGRAMSGATAEVVQELRNKGGYRGVPVPFEVFEQRAGETVAAGVPENTQTHSIIDRLFPGSAAAEMGAQMVNIASGVVEYPVTTSSVTAGWSTTELGDVAGPTTYATTDRVLKPNQTLGITMHISRRAQLQAQGLEEAIRRDMRGTIAAELDKAVFQGTGANGQPAGVVAKFGDYGIGNTANAGVASWSAFRAAVVAFISANAAAGPGQVRALIRPEAYGWLDDAMFDAGSGITEFDKLMSSLGAVVMSSNALADPTGTAGSLKTNALLTTTAGGVAPMFVATWGAIDLIRDPYSDAASGGLRLTGLITADVTVARPAQLHVLSQVTEPSSA